MGVYSIAPSGQTSLNYTITYQAGTLTITRALVTLTLTVDLSGFANNNVVRLRVAAAPASLAGSVLTGTVKFYLDGRPLTGTQALGTGGIAIRTIRIAQAPSNHTFRAVFTSSNPNLQSADQTMAFSVPANAGETPSRAGGV